MQERHSVQGGGVHRSQVGHHQLRQHRFRYAHRLPVYHHGGMDHRALLRQWGDCICGGFVSVGKSLYMWGDLYL